MEKSYVIVALRSLLENADQHNFTNEEEDFLFELLNEVEGYYEDDYVSKAIVFDDIKSIIADDTMEEWEKVEDIAEYIESYGDY